MDRSPRLIPLVDSAGLPAGRVGRKAQLLGWAEAGGMATPGGLVLPADRFWAALDACGVSGQVRYVQQAALRLDPAHAVGIAGAIAETMDVVVLERLAADDAGAAFARLDASRVVCRSSSAMEDGRTAAFPGVFASVLDIDSPVALAGAIARCWRSAFSATAIRCLLRVRAEPVDLSLALLLQRQVEAAWFGVYVSVDPVTGALEPLADLSAAGPDALVNSAGAEVRARRRDGGWAGAGDLAPALEAVHLAGARLAAHTGGPVDIEFAVPGAGADPAILQCRPLTHVGGAPAPGVPSQSALRGRPCAGGRAVGLVPEEILVVDRLTPAGYDAVLAASGVVTEEDASPLSHAAILCRELGVPFVCGVDGARANLAGRRVAVDGHTGEIEVLGEAGAASAAAAAPPPAHAAPTLSAVELLLRVLAEGRPGHPPAAEARRLARRYARALGGGPVRVVALPVASDELERLQRLGAGLFGPEFSAAGLLADISSTHVPEHHTTPRPGAARDG